MACLISANSVRTDKQDPLGQRGQLEKPITRNGVLDAGDGGHSRPRTRSDENVVCLYDFPSAQLDSALANEFGVCRKVLDAIPPQVLQVLAVEDAHICVALLFEGGQVEWRRDSSVKPVASEERPRRRKACSVER